MDEGKRVLDVGCGSDKLPGAVGIDFDAESRADIVHDLNIIPWPFDNDWFDEIRCWSILEHLDNIILIMEEIHRIARDGAIISIGTPHFSSINSFCDPTHKHHFTSRSFDYFIEGTEYSVLYPFYSKAIYRLLDKRVSLSPFWRSLRLTRLVNRYLFLWEKYFCFLVRGADLYLTLQVVKDSKAHGSNECL